MKKRIDLSFFKTKIDKGERYLSNHGAHDADFYRKKFNKSFLIFCNISSFGIERFKGVSGFNCIGVNKTDGPLIDYMDKYLVFPLSKLNVFVIEDESLIESDFSGLFLLYKESELVLIQGEKRFNFSLEEKKQFDVLFLMVAKNAEAICRGDITPEDIFANIEKKKLFHGRPNHPIMKFSGRKIDTWRYLKQLGFLTPEMFYVKKEGEVVVDRLDELPKSFVKKSDRGCSGMAVNIFKKTEGTEYQDLLSNTDKLYDFSDILQDIDSDSSCIVEEKVGEDGFIPYDLKVYCNHGSPRVVVLFDRNYKKRDGVVYTTAFDIKTRKQITPYFINDQARFNEPKNELSNEYKRFMSESVVREIYDTAVKFLEAAEYSWFISIDFFYSDGKLYFGELTKNPGAFHFHIQPAHVIEHIMSTIDDH